MKKLFGLLAFAFFSLALLNHCNTPAQAKRFNHPEKGILDTGQLSSLKLYLQNIYGTKVQDTIIIKYDFNGDYCWNALDKQDKTKIKRVNSSYQNSIEEISNQRPGISIFQFREEGQDQSAFKTENPDIRLDNGYLRSLLFKQKATCGCSTIILPGGQFTITKSDAHFEAINVKSSQKLK